MTKNTISGFDIQYLTRILQDSISNVKCRDRHKIKLNEILPLPFSIMCLRTLFEGVVFDIPTGLEVVVENNTNGLGMMVLSHDKLELL